MTNIIEVAKQILELIALIGVFAATVGFAWGQFKSGKIKGASQQTIDNTALIKTLEERYDVLSREMQRQNEEHKSEREVWHKESGELKRQLGELQGIIKEKDGKLAEYKEIFQGRNPQLDEFIKSSGEFQVTLMNFMAEVKTYIQPK